MSQPIALGIQLSPFQLTSKGPEGVTLFVHIPRNAQDKKFR